MKPTYKTIFAATLCLIGMTACIDNDTPSQEEIQTLLPGKWKSVETNGVPTPTNDRSVWTYEAGGKGVLSMALYDESANTWVWANKANLSYTLDKDLMMERADKYEFLSKVRAIGTAGMTKQYSAHGVEDGIVLIEKYERMTADYSKEILGTWETIEISDEQTYEYPEMRIEFKADGSYIFSANYDGIWFPIKDASNAYNLDGNWLAMRWQPTVGSEFLYEMWDIDEATDKDMKWSAVRARKDGSQYKATMTWKKVITPSEAEAKEKIIGCWTNTTASRIIVKNGKVIESDIRNWSFLQQFTFNKDNTMVDYIFDADADNYEETNLGKYLIKDNLLMMVYNENPVQEFDETKATTIVEIDNETMKLQNIFREPEQPDEDWVILTVLKKNVEANGKSVAGETIQSKVDWNHCMKFTPLCPWNK